MLDGQAAALQVGSQVPITTQSAQAVDTSSTAPIVSNVDYKDVGVILNVLPKVNANGIVTLDVEQVISAVTSNVTGATDPPRNLSWMSDTPARNVDLDGVLGWLLPWLMPCMMTGRIAGSR